MKTLSTPETRDNITKVQLIKVDYYMSRIEFKMEKGYMDGEDFVADGSTTYAIDADDFATYFDPDADDSKSIKENFEDAIYSWYSANVVTLS